MEVVKVHTNTDLRTKLGNIGDERLFILVCQSTKLSLNHNSLLLPVAYNSLEAHVFLNSLYKMKTVESNFKTRLFY